MNLGAAPTRTVVEELAAWGGNLRYEDVPDRVIDRLKVHLLDAIGCGIGAADAVPTVISRTVAEELSDGGPSTLIGGRRTTSPELATFANSVAIRYLDYCDVYLGVEVTPPAANVSAVLAIGEAMAASGADCLLGTAVLYESLLRLCSAGSLHERGWDTVTFGAIASSLAAAKMLKLDFVSTCNAISIATVHAPALLQTRVGELSMWKGAASAYAARSGVFAAYVARAGMTGPYEVFEGKFGFRKQVLETFELPPADWRTPSVLIKRYPAQVFTQSAIEAAIKLRQRREFEVDDIQHVVVHTFARAIAGAAAGKDRWAPQSRETADHSLPFVIASALLDGEVTPEQFSEAKIRQAAIQNLLPRIEVIEDTAMTARFPEQTPASVEVRLRSGTLASEEVPIALGHPNRPMGADEVGEKFRRLAEPRVGEQVANRIRNSLQMLESISEIGTVTSMLSG